MILHFLLLYTASCFLGTYHQANDTFLWSDMIVTNEADIQLAQAPATPFQTMEEMEENHLNVTFDYGATGSQGKVLAINRYPLSMRADSTSNYLFNISQNTTSRSGQFKCTLSLFYQLYLPSGFKSQFAITVLFAGQDVTQLQECNVTASTDLIGNHMYNFITSQNYEHMCLLLYPYDLSFNDSINITKINHYMIGSQYLKNNDRLIGFMVKMTTAGSGHFQSKFKFVYDGPISHTEDISIRIDNFQLMSQQYSLNKFSQDYTNVSMPVQPTTVSGIMMDYFYMGTATLYSYTRAAIGIVDGNTVGSQQVYNFPATTTNSTIKIKLNFSYSRQDEGETAQIECCVTLKLVDASNVHCSDIMVCPYWSPTHTKPTMSENITVGQMQFEYGQQNGSVSKYVFISQVEDIALNETDMMEFIRVVKTKHTEVEHMKIVSVEAGFKVFFGYGRVNFNQMAFIPSPVDTPPQNNTSTTNTTDPNNTTSNVTNHTTSNSTNNATDANNSTNTTQANNTTTNTATNITDSNTTNSNITDANNTNNTNTNTTNNTNNTNNSTHNNTLPNSIEPITPNYLQDSQNSNCSFNFTDIRPQCLPSYMSSLPLSIINAILSIPTLSQLLGLQPLIANINYLSFYAFHQTTYDPFLTTLSKLSFNITNSQWIPFFTRQALGITNSQSALDYSNHNLSHSSQPFQLLFKQFILVYVPVSIALFQLIRLILSKLTVLQQFRSLSFFVSHTSMLLLILSHNIQPLTFGTVLYIKHSLNHKLNEVSFTIATALLMVAVTTGVCSYISMWLTNNNFSWTPYNGKRGYVLATFITLQAFISSFCQAYVKQASQVNVCMALGALGVMCGHLIMRKVYLKTVNWIFGTLSSLVRLLISTNAIFQSSAQRDSQSALWMSIVLVAVFTLLTLGQIIVDSVIPFVQHIVRAIKKLHDQKRSLPVKDRSCLREDMSEMNIQQMEQDQKCLKRKIKLMRDLQLQHVLKMHRVEMGRATSPRR